jgi:hypothetical protein
MYSMTSAIQSVRFKRAQWTPAERTRWLRDHEFVPIKRADITRTEARYRIREPGLFRRFAVIRTRKGINLVIGFV